MTIESWVRVYECLIMNHLKTDCDCESFLLLLRIIFPFLSCPCLSGDNWSHHSRTSLPFNVQVSWSLTLGQDILRNRLQERIRNCIYMYRWWIQDLIILEYSQSILEGYICNHNFRLRSDDKSYILKMSWDFIIGLCLENIWITSLWNWILIRLSRFSELWRRTFTTISN